MSLAKKTIPLYNIIAGGRKAEKEEKVVGALTTFFVNALGPATDIQVYILILYGFWFY